ncbi:MAG: cysteine desulfurase [Planctomycetales bacterium]|nr:cysteine desulfurase [Planctomycetales bacterium]
MSQRIYLDYNATTPLSEFVKAELVRLLELDLGNPSSRHWAGTPAAEIVELSRIRVASLIGCDPTEIIFTSGGTEANNHAIKGVFFANLRRLKQPHFIISSIEHPAVTEPLRFLETLGARVTRVPVDGYGLVNPDDIRRAIEPETVLVSVMLANNEVGTIQPIEEIAVIARGHEILFHTDAAQAVGKIAVDVESMGVDLLSIAGHKLYAPQGIGALYVREGVELAPFMHGAGHEGGRRAGTENILEMAALGVACHEAADWVDDPRIEKLRDYFWQRLQDEFGERVRLNGHPSKRLPNTLNVSFDDIAGYDLLDQLPFLAASTGSACHAGKQLLSPVLSAMGLSADRCTGAIRFSLGRETHKDGLNQVVNCLVSEVGNFRST